MQIEKLKNVSRGAQFYFPPTESGQLFTLADGQMEVLDGHCCLPLTALKINSSGVQFLGMEVDVAILNT